MIHKPTVLILGAGSAVQLNFPTGENLKRRIYQNFENDYPNFPIPSIYKDDPKEEIIKQRRKDAERFCTDLKNLKTNITIDYFLKNNRDKYVEIGKLAIIYYLLDYENKSKPLILDDDWYSLLFSNITRECYRNGHPEEFLKNNLKIITFNYDRSFEYFLETGFTSFFSSDKKRELHKILKKIEVQHVYGSLGQLPWQSDAEKDNNDPNSVAYGESFREKFYRAEYMQGIKIIGDNEISFKDELSKIIGWGERVVFMGFAFDENNLKMLGLPDSLSKYQGIQLIGTTYGLSNNDIVNVANFFQIARPAPSLNLQENRDCLTLANDLFR